MELPANRPEKIKLKEINPYLTCYLCKGYLIDATTISECLHSFCRSCIIKFLQDNSFCPVCEVIINKAKPNLKLDKTLQDIVYKLVPELFLKEMTRRKRFYKQYPQIAARVSPEERGEDTERTIFNPQDCISLSMEYISDDSAPGAICLPGTKNGLDKHKTLTAEENQALMKRYLQCPGMCRVEVLKKFVRNKYNVDTSRFYIDVLYKRVPLPDHYTLIDIAYIYSWKRNEPMKFYFRITDINKISERFDFFSGAPTPEYFVTAPVRASRPGGEKKSRRRESVAGRKTKRPSQESASACDKSEVKATRTVVGGDANGECDSANGAKSPGVSETRKIDRSEKTVVVAPSKEISEKTVVVRNKETLVAPNKETLVVRNKETVNGSGALLKSEIAEQLKSKFQNEKKSVYTNITLNRTNNVEIITKIQKVSNKEGQAIGLNIIKQTVKKAPTNASPLKPLPKKVGINEKKLEVPADETTKTVGVETKDLVSVIDEEKYKFLKSIELTARTAVPKPNEAVASSSGLKRKAPSPVKDDKAKKFKPTTKVIIQPKPPNQIKLVPGAAQRSNGLQSFIDNCKINIPSSLSITLKETSEGRPPPLLPPVKNYIEILKLDESDTSKTVLCDNDSEQKVDQDLAEIAKSLTERIPMSTTVSQIVGTKPQFPIPVKSNAPLKFHVHPSPVPDVKVLSVPKDNKLNPRSPQTFQKIFEESIKKPEESAKVSEPDTQTGVSSPKRNILEIASQLYKKTKLEQQEQESVKNEDPVPKVPIPRLPSQKSVKTKQFPSPGDGGRYQQKQTVASLHSNALGLNYTVSVGQSVPGKVNGVVKKEPDVKSEKRPVTPKEVPKQQQAKKSPGLGYSSPKHSPKSSPAVKHMYAPAPGSLDQAKLPSPKANNLSKVGAGSAKEAEASSSKSMNSNQLLEKYNIQNLAQLTASLNFNAASLGLSPNNQLAAFQHAMLLKHFEMQNRQNWLSMNQGPLLQYEKYLQSLKSNQTKLLGNIKEN